MTSLVDKYQTLQDSISNLNLSEEDVLLLLANALLEHTRDKISEIDKTIKGIIVDPDILVDYNKVFIESEYSPQSYTYLLATLSHNLIAISNEIRVLKVETYGK